MTVQDNPFLLKQGQETTNIKLVRKNNSLTSFIHVAHQGPSSQWQENSVK
jgi:hypothetical protein